MLISKKDFEKSIKKLDPEENVIIYAEKSGSEDLITCMFGNSAKIMTAMLCLIEKYGDEQGLTTTEILEHMLIISRLYHSTKEGRDY